MDNKGFTGAMRRAWMSLKAHTLALVNNDARADKTWLENLIRPMLQDRTVGICASKLIFENSQTVNSAGDGLTTAGVGFNRGLGQKVGQFETPEPVFGACGAAVFYRRQLYWSFSAAATGRLNFHWRGLKSSLAGTTSPPK